MKLQWCALLVGLLVFSGCKTVELEEPIGTPLKAPLNKKQLDGHWLLDVGENPLPFTVIVKNETSGTLQVAWIDANKKEEFELRKADVVIREINGKRIVNMKVYPSADEKDKEPVWILFGRIELGKDQRAVWYPECDEFNKFIKAGKLPGEPRDSNPGLGKLTPAHLDVISSNTSTLFNWEEPMILKKLGE